MKKLIVEGIVVSIEEATYDYGDVKDENYCSMLVIPLLQFEGKRVRVTVEEIEA